VDWDLAELRAGLPGLMPDLGEETAAWLTGDGWSLDELEARGEVDLPWPPPADARPRDLVPGLGLDVRIAGLETTPPRQSRPWRLDGRLVLEGAAAELRDAVAAVGAGSLSASAGVEGLDGERATCDFRVDLDAFPARPLLEVVAPAAAPYLEGGAAAELAGGLRLGDGQEMLESLDLEGDVLLTDGVVHATSWLDGISPYLGERQELKDIRYDRMAQHLRVENGRLHLEGLALDGRDTDWTGGGWLGLTGGIDMRLQVKLPPGFRPDLGRFSGLTDALAGEDERIALGLRLTGRAASPKVTLDLKADRERVAEEVQEGIKGLLDKLRGNK
jgi:hypothetical protein